MLVEPRDGLADASLQRSATERTGPSPKGEAVPLPGRRRRLKVVAATVRTAMRSGEGSERRHLSSTATLSARALERDADRRSGRTKVL